jgi:hydroxyacylglutathione hydrolase
MIMQAVQSLHAVVDEGLGNSAYLVNLGDGRALAVDPPRDLRAIRAVADRQGLRIAFAADTHLHADFLSGACQLAATDGVRVLASAAGGREFAHQRLVDGDEVDLGGLRLRAWETPGHTGEHLAFVLLDGQRPVGVFTGGSLLVSSAARTDLVDPARTEELARAQYTSIQRLLTLPDATAVWPTHGAGSFCSAPPGTERTSTIGQERLTNPLLAAGSQDGFVTGLLAGLGTFPGYFLRLGEANRVGPAVVTEPVTLPALDVPAVRAALETGARVVDVRSLPDYASEHLPGSVSVPLRPAFATWLGWLTDPTDPLIIVRNDDQDPEDVAWQALKIGHDNLIGELAGGITAWTGAGGTLTSTALIGADRIGAQTVLDVRQQTEFASGHLPGAIHLELGDVAARAHDLPLGPVVVMCGHGERAMSAASLLEIAGHRDISVLDGGPRSWAETTGHALVTEPARTDPAGLESDRPTADPAPTETDSGART